MVAAFFFLGVVLVFFGFEIAAADLDFRPITPAEPLAPGVKSAESVRFSVSILLFLATFWSFQLSAKSTDEPGVASEFSKPVAQKEKFRVLCKHATLCFPVGNHDRGRDGHTGIHRRYTI